MTGDNQLREMLTASMALRKEADQEKMVSGAQQYFCVVDVVSFQMLQEAINKLEELCKRKEKSLQVCSVYLLWDTLFGYCRRPR